MLKINATRINKNLINFKEYCINEIKVQFIKQNEKLEKLT